MNRKQLLSTLLTIFLTLPLSAQSQSLPYQNPQLKAEQRADDLLKRLSLEEKVQLMMKISLTVVTERRYLKLLRSLRSRFHA